MNLNFPNKPYFDKFNVISCGYILKAILGGSAKAHWPECAKMNGIIKPGQ